MHSTILIAALSMLSAANAALLLGTASDGPSEYYTWLQGQDPCSGTSLNTDPCAEPFTVPNGNALFNYVGCSPAFPQYNERNGKYDAECGAFTEGPHQCGVDIGTITTYAICDSANN